MPAPLEPPSELPFSFAENAQAPSATLASATTFIAESVSTASDSHHHPHGVRRDRARGRLLRGVAIAQQVLCGHTFVLLDEPSSGLDQVETQRFGAILTEVAGHGTTILLVEHDMALVNRICDHVFVIDFGKPIFDGTVAQVAASPIVRHAYLGDEELIVDIGMSEEELS